MCNYATKEEKPRDILDYIILWHSANVSNMRDYFYFLKILILTDYSKSGRMMHFLLQI